MIVSSIESTSRTTGLGEEIEWRCLARRGMLYSECEAVDYLRLRPGTEFVLRGRRGTGGALFVVSGEGMLHDPGLTQSAAMLATHDVVLLAHDEELVLLASKGGMELLWLAVTPHALTRILPHRRPAI